MTAQSSYWYLSCRDITGILLLDRSTQQCILPPCNDWQVSTVARLSWWCCHSMADRMHAHKKNNAAETYSGARHGQHTCPRFKHVLLVQRATGAETPYRCPVLTTHTSIHQLLLLLLLPFNSHFSRSIWVCHLPLRYRTLPRKPMGISGTVSEGQMSFRLHNYQCQSISCNHWSCFILYSTTAGLLKGCCLSTSSLITSVKQPTTLSWTLKWLHASSHSKKFLIEWLIDSLSDWLIDWLVGCSN